MDIQDEASRLQRQADEDAMVALAASIAATTTIIVARLLLG